MEDRLLKLLHIAVEMLIDEDVLFVDIISGLGLTNEEVEKFGFDEY